MLTTRRYDLHSGIRQRIERDRRLLVRRHPGPRWRTRLPPPLRRRVRVRRDQIIASAGGPHRARYCGAMDWLWPLFHRRVSRSLYYLRAFSRGMDLLVTAHLPISSRDSLIAAGCERPGRPPVPPTEEEHDSDRDSQQALTNYTCLLPSGFSFSLVSL